ncbi:hypothetical protein CCYA_CCYA01G0018 [Cyanidiococcus yangmingshanensis]|uniref:RNA helicase n=1 Tax=Cyanidiococcus yangmingshanensis TaxID=2690220 RepID=A0A7J7ISJ6_9RHOD|nr:Nucleolar RNA helicase 2 [Cyanidiococcus yangmingshanensis]KAK4529161.1 hypothetical protein CCYA_CCYA01G0018 [Cyanidiococcus yangmingshanensis]
MTFISNVLSGIQSTGLFSRAGSWGDPMTRLCGQPSRFCNSIGFSLRHNQAKFTYSPHKHVPTRRCSTLMKVPLPAGEAEAVSNGSAVDAVVTVHGSVRPDWKLERFPLSSGTAAVLRERGITELTEIQALTFDDMRNGLDVIGRSHTGTGKTYAFGVPMVERLAAARGGERGARGRPPSALVLTPTRELAKQVTEQLRQIGQPHDLRVECFYGGASYGPQEDALQRGLDIVVGTPGRILDHIERNTLDLSQVRIAILDEADEMLSMGFAEDVERIFNEMPSKNERQTVLFSATVPPWVQKIAAQHQRTPVIHDVVGKTETRAAKNVRHVAVRVPEADFARLAMLEDIIFAHAGSGNQRCIVFTGTKREADEIAMAGSIFRGSVAQVLHGDVSQRQRELTLQQFRDGRFSVLVATDVAARGLDIHEVDVVVQLRPPRDADTYIHRSGRTGRAGRSGTAVTMYSDAERGLLRSLERGASIRFEHVGPPTLERVLDVAAQNAARAVGEASTNQVVPHFQQAADELATVQFEGDARRALAAALAVISGRTHIEHRSLLTGEIGLRTLLLTLNQPEISPRDVLGIVRRLSQGGKLFSDDIGKVRLCRNPRQAVFDVSVESADEILRRIQSSGTQDESASKSTSPQSAASSRNGTSEHSKAMDYSIEVCAELPELRVDDYRFSPGRLERRRGRSLDDDADRVYLNGRTRDLPGGRTGRRERSSRTRGGRPLPRRSVSYTGDLD